MTEWFHPALVFFLGALLVPFFPGRLRQALLLAVPAGAFVLAYLLPSGMTGSYQWFGLELTLLRVDSLSRIFTYVYSIAALGIFLFALREQRTAQHVAAMAYIGASIGAVLAGDLITLYIFWEVMAVASTFLILVRGTSSSLQSAFRYILVHLFGGLCLLAGILLQMEATGAVAFEGFAAGSLAEYLILVGFLVNVAAPPFSAWLSDAYPRGTATGSIFLTAYTTKTAVYALVRGFPGWEILLVVGGVMAIYGIVFAFLENDMRRVLAFSIINQNGFMVAGVGIGTALALNGAVTHALACLIYIALLWMCAGAVLQATGKHGLHELGGLYRAMPLTFAFAVIGALAIASFPGVSGFTTKPMVIKEAAYGGFYWLWLTLEVASAGVVFHAGLKFPYLVFFGRDRGLAASDPPRHMLAAMALLAGICLLAGLFPGSFYGLLPYEAHFIPYTVEQVFNQLQLLLFGALAFFLLLPRLATGPSVILDTDWFYRLGGALFYGTAEKSFNCLNAWAERLFAHRIPSLLAAFFAEPGGNIQKAVWLPLLRTGGRSGEDLEKEREKIDCRSHHGAYPIGGGVLLAVLFLALMSFLFFL
jgi:multicomponent Na+:H+ antiporter subunit D